MSPARPRAETKNPSRASRGGFFCPPKFGPIGLFPPKDQTRNDRFLFGRRFIKKINHYVHFSNQSEVAAEPLVVFNKIDNQVEQIAPDAEVSFEQVDYFLAFVRINPNAVL